MKSVPSTLRLVQLAGIVLFFHVTHSLLQEQVFHLPGFHHALLLSFLQTFSIAIFAVVDFFRQGCERKTPLVYYVALSVLAVVTSFATNEASIRLDYPTQVIFKSSKLLAVMLLRSFMMQHKGKLSSLDWASGAAVVIGLVAFTFATHEAKAVVATTGVTTMASADSSSGNNHHNNDAGAPLHVLSSTAASGSHHHHPAGGGHLYEALTTTSSFAVGVIAVLIAVAADALLYLVEEKYCFHTFGSSSGEILVFLNAFAAVNAGTMLVASGRTSESFSYLSVTGVLAPLVLAYSLCNFLGTTAILSIVSEFGSPSAIIVTSTRKVCTILGSYVVYPKPFTLLHAAGLMLVTGGVYAHEYARKMKAAVRPSEDEEEPAASPV